MTRSTVLWLYLLWAERGRVPNAVERRARPSGSLVWVHGAPGTRPESLRQIATILQRERPGTFSLLTCESGDVPDPELFPATCLSDRSPSERLPDLRAFLDHWHPQACLVIGTSLRAGLIHETHARGIPLLMADAKFDTDPAPIWRRGLVRSLLNRFARILAQDSASVAALRAAGGPSLGVELGGRIEESTDPLPCNEAERHDNAELLKARPVWLAVSCPIDEEEAVIAAHIHALSYAHRLLLILCPSEPARAPALAQRIADAGLIAAIRAADQEPDANVQVLITDGPSELGLWYRLAPVSYMGGSLSHSGAQRSPYEPAALGSAIVHGPFPGAYPEAFQRLSDARATRPVGDGDELCNAIADLIAPDKAALLAHSAWVTASGGAEVAERVVAATLASLDLVANDQKALPS